MFSHDFILFIALFAFIPLIIISVVSGKIGTALSLLLFIVIILTEDSNKINGDNVDMDLVSSESLVVVDEKKTNRFLFISKKEISTSAGTFYVNNDFGDIVGRNITINTYKDKNNNNNIFYQVCSYDKVEKDTMCYDAKK
jgi:hypothetical protein